MADEPSLSPGIYVVATPIGNLGDLSPRARAVLEAAHTVVVEDTRVAQRLGLSGQPRFVTLSEHNVGAKAPQLVEVARAHPVALTSDAGTPAISDPGARLVEAAHAAGVPVFAVPGPSALAAALSVSGFQLGEARFLGFLSHKQGARRAELKRHRGSGAVLVLFEAPTRLAATIADIAAVLDDPEIVVCRELTKRFEEVVRGRASGLVERFADARGECVVVVQTAAQSSEDVNLEDVSAYMAEMQRAGARRTAAAAEAAKRFGLSRSAAYDLWPRDSE